mmetsp:Transcript_5378/g.11851  ORF Transcript_5378/g.11851 Transcript_5378/m.11851 type:complete len:326 (-) Transcript_5378:8-985(-)
MKLSYVRSPIRQSSHGARPKRTQPTPRRAAGGTRSRRTCDAHSPRDSTPATLELTSPHSRPHPTLQAATAVRGSSAKDEEHQDDQHDREDEDGAELAVLLVLEHLLHHRDGLAHAALSFVNLGRELIKRLALRDELLVYRAAHVAEPRHHPRERAQLLVLVLQGRLLSGLLLLYHLLVELVRLVLPCRRGGLHLEVEVGRGSRRGRGEKADALSSFSPPLGWCGLSRELHPHLHSLGERGLDEISSMLQLGLVEAELLRVLAGDLHRLVHVLQVDIEFDEDLEQRRLECGFLGANLEPPARHERSNFCALPPNISLQPWPRVVHF